MKDDPCWCCGSPSESKHHLKPKRNAGPDSHDNLLDLCNACHQVVDCTDQPTKGMLERILEFPRIHLLMSIRSMADIAALRKSRGMQRQVIRWALRAMDQPENETVRKKLLGALETLKTQTPTHGQNLPAHRRNPNSKPPQRERKRDNA